MSALGSILNCCTALGKTFSVGPLVTLNKECSPGTNKHINSEIACRKFTPEKNVTGEEVSLKIPRDQSPGCSRNLLKQQIR